MYTDKFTCYYIKIQFGKIIDNLFNLFVCVLFFLINQNIYRYIQKLTPWNVQIPYGYNTVLLYFS